MIEYKSLEKNRKAKQFIMAIVFLVIFTGGWFYPWLGYFIPLCMLLGVGIGLFHGRKWCDWYCPRGSFYDTLIKPLSPKKEIPSFFRGLSFRLGVIAFLTLIMTLNLAKRWPSYYKIGMFFVTLVTITTILGIILALIFHSRTWCSFCPIGTVVSVAGKNKHPLKINSELCAECKLCSKVCPVQIRPYLFCAKLNSRSSDNGAGKDKGIWTVKKGDCLKCGLCVAVCPRKALSF